MLGLLSVSLEMMGSGFLLTYENVQQNAADHDNHCNNLNPIVVFPTEEETADKNDGCDYHKNRSQVIFDRVVHRYVVLFVFCFAK